MQDLKVALIQTDLHWHNAEANRAMLEEKISEMESPVDLILLPEMFSTGFTMDAVTQAEPMNFKSLRWLKNMAAQTGAVVSGSVIINAQGKYFNRLFWVHPDGDYKTYDKRHLFRFAGEHQTFTPGKEKLLVSLKGWQILPLICYDLRFPVWSKNNYDEEKGFDFDLVFYLSNWPKARTVAWDALLKARAIENSAYCIGLNRVGTDGNNIEYSGHSVCYNPKGEAVIELHDENTVAVVELSGFELKRYREKFQVQLDWDNFVVH